MFLVSSYRPSGSWGTPRDLSYARGINPGPIVGEIVGGASWGDSKVIELFSLLFIFCCLCRHHRAHTRTQGNIRTQGKSGACSHAHACMHECLQGGVQITVRGGEFGWNTAVGGSSEGDDGGGGGGLGYGGGVAVALGTYELQAVSLRDNWAARGSQIAVPGVQGETVYNEDSPATELKRGPNNYHPTSRTMTSLVMQDCVVQEHVARHRAVQFQVLQSATAYTCAAPVGTKCSVVQTRPSGWNHTHQPNLPPEKRPGALYMQHVTALVHATTFGDEESPPADRNLTCWAQHSACLSATVLSAYYTKGVGSADATASCFAHGVMRFPCCQMDLRCPSDGGVWGT